MTRVPCGVGVLVVAPNQNREVVRYVTMLRKGSHGAGKWATPGGWVDPGEDPSETVKRECMEELGIEVLSEPVFLGYTHDLHDEGVEDICLWFYVDSYLGLPEIMEPDKCERLSAHTMEALTHMPQEALFTPTAKFLELHQRVLAL